MSPCISGKSEADLNKMSPPVFGVCIGNEELQVLDSTAKWLDAVFSA